jgi:CheY-like chemotaxis protein
MMTTHDPFRDSAFRGSGGSDAARVDGSVKIAPVRRGRILVVDDEAAICASLKRLFTRHHVVSTVTSSMAALELFNAGERFDIVLCDLMMPEMGGLDLYQEVTRAAPEQASRFVFMSGASLSAQVSAFLATLPNALLHKPFDMRRLVDLVRDRLK